MLEGLFKVNFLSDGVRHSLIKRGRVSCIGDHDHTTPLLGACSKKKKTTVKGKEGVWVPSRVQYRRGEKSGGGDAL